MGTDQDWARAFAKQALCDLDAREKLTRAEAHKCHRLLFLQMAAEKVCKAYLTIGGGHGNVSNTHGYVAKHLPRIAVYFQGIGGNQMTNWERHAIERLAAEIQVAAPACRDDNREDNCEYPWEDAQGAVRVPCEHNFPKIDDSSRNNAIVKLIRLIRTAAESYVA
ncbi:MAG: hypothetical protein WBX38_06355 [Candidatus Sulfotelmatobacter sp.]